MNSYKDVTTYNNFYEFGLDKGDPRALRAHAEPAPWSVVVEGHCAKPGKYDIEDIVKLVPARGAHLPHALRRGVVDGRFRGSASRWPT